MSQQQVESLLWRKSFGVNDIQYDGISEDLWKSGVAMNHGYDVSGHNVVILQISKHKKDRDTSRNMMIRKWIAFCYEMHQKVYPNKKICMVFDMTGAGLSNMDMEMVRFFVNCFKIYFPDAIQWLLVYNMPWVLQAVWKIVRSWMSEREVAKVKFVTKENIQEYIPMGNLLAKYGGTDPWEFVYEVEREVMLHHIREAAEKSQEVKELPDGDEASGNGSLPVTATVGGILISPPNELVFTGVKNADICSTLTITNVSSHTVVFKISSTVHDTYLVRPSPKLTLMVPRAVTKILVKPVQGTEATQANLVVKTCTIPDQNSVPQPSDLNLYWKALPASAIKQHRIMCRRVFTEATPNNPNPKVSHRSTTPRANSTRTNSTQTPSNPQDSGRSNLKVGSPVQLPAVDGGIKYGTIKWIGLVPLVQEEIAGIEMDDNLEGCSDGTFQNTGQKFFESSPGKGLYYPLKSLVAVDECRLKQLYLQVKRENESLCQQNADQQAESTQVKEELQQQITGLTNALQQKEDEIRNKQLQIVDLQQKLEANSTQIQPLSTKAELNTVSRAEVKRIPKKRIGVGAWGEVYSARFRGEDVAIKIAHREILHQSTVDMLEREIQIMSSVQHPNLVRFIAAVVDDAVEQKVDTPIIISELMDMNLRAAYNAKDLSSQLLSIFCDVAYALHYLHQHREPIIHRDISAPNVLLKSLPGGLYRAKISDFGSANLVKQSKTGGVGAIVYSAPEMFPSEGIAAQPQLPKQSPKVDVYSYGVLLLEVVVKEMPSQDTSYALLQKVKGQWSTMYELIVHCTKRSPSDRPTMADILKQLNSVPH